MEDEKNLYIFLEDEKNLYNIHFLKYLEQKLGNHLNHRKIVRAHTERSMFVASLPVSASRFEIVSVTQSSVKTAPQAKKIDAVCGFLKDFYVMKNVMSLSPKARDFFVNFPYRNQCFLGFG